MIKRPCKISRKLKAHELTVSGMAAFSGQNSDEGCGTKPLEAYRCVPRVGSFRSQIPPILGLSTNKGLTIVLLNCL